VRRRARDAGVDLRQVRGSGPAGRISHDDLDAFLRGAGGTAPRAARVANTKVETIKMMGLRRRIAQKMAESKRRIAHFSYVEEVDVTALEELRKTLNAEERPDHPRLTLIPFLMQALVKAIVDFPEMNALYDDEAETIDRHGGVHIGIATQTDAGLLVPVVRHCEARSFGSSRQRSGGWQKPHGRARRHAPSSLARRSPSPASARWAASSQRR
jgi:Pyruvate/2-oxoglutarate dehydrogenase complex, dihydrolipoamide acyltransferase (E2) component, and related enzymes